LLPLPDASAFFPFVVGLDLYFLNRATVLNVTSSEQVANVFNAPPGGLTPTTPVLQHVLQAKRAISAEKKVLVIIATDGAPTNAQGEVDTAGLRHVLTAERDPSRFHVQFIACTDDDSTMAYLNEWDRKIPSLDVVDDYHSEKAEIQKAKGKDFPFTFGNYVRDRTATAALLRASICHVLHTRSTLLLVPAATLSLLSLTTLVHARVCLVAGLSGLLLYRS
jgi:hypothetical protein